MNAAYIAIGAAFVAIGGAALTKAKRSTDPVKARNNRTSGVLMMLAGAIFFVTGLIAGS